MWRQARERTSQADEVVSHSSDANGDDAHKRELTTSSVRHRTRKSQHSCVLPSCYPKALHES